MPASKVPAKASRFRAGCTPRPLPRTQRGQSIVSWSLIVWSSAFRDRLLCVAGPRGGRRTAGHRGLLRSARQAGADAGPVIGREAALLLRRRRRALGDGISQRDSRERGDRAALAERRRRIGAAGVADARAERLRRAADPLLRRILNDRRRTANVEVTGLRIVDDAEAACPRRVARDRRAAQSPTKIADVATASANRSI